MSQLSRETGLGRETLYKALTGEGNPSFAIILKVTAALGIKLHAQPLHMGSRALLFYAFGGGRVASIENPQHCELELK